MKAAILRGFGEVDQFIVEEVDNPTPKVGEAVVEIYAASLNRRDVWIRQNKYPNIKLPAILGSDGCGVVISTGSEKDKNLIGKKVVIYPGFNWGEENSFQRKDFTILGMPTNGTCAEQVVVPVENLFEKPTNLNYSETSTLPIAGLTAYRAIVNKAKLKPNENILITGIGGGVAMFALQFALEFSKNVFVTSSSKEKIDKAISLGAKEGVVFPSGKNFKDEIYQLTNGKGIDVLIDGTTGELLSNVADAMNSGGRIVIYGATSLSPVTLPARHLFWKQLNVLGTTCGSPKEFSEMLKFVESKNIHPVIDSLFSLEKIKEAHAKLEKGSQCGKIVIEIKR